MGLAVRLHGSAARAHGADAVGAQFLPEQHGVAFRLHDDPRPAFLPVAENGVARAAAHHSLVLGLIGARMLQTHLDALQRPVRAENGEDKTGGQVDAALAAVLVFVIGQAPGRVFDEQVLVVPAYPAGRCRGRRDAPGRQPLMMGRREPRRAFFHPLRGAVLPAGLRGDAFPGREGTGRTRAVRIAAALAAALVLRSVFFKKSLDGLQAAFRQAHPGGVDVHQIPVMLAAVTDGAVQLRVVPAGTGRFFLVPRAVDAQLAAGSPAGQLHQITQNVFTAGRAQIFHKCHVSNPSNAS